jgi:3'-phosphoadenosine 5'-phosphosulfate sulfotransferase (PAPS reductase)/FAD synthetase
MSDDRVAMNGANQTRPIQGRLDGRTLDDAIAEAHAIIEEALDIYAPVTQRYVLFSGGNDSLVLLHLASRWLTGEKDGALHINTGIGIPETRDFALRAAQEITPRFYERINVDYPFERLVLDKELRGGGGYGFPGPAGHHFMYIRLKERTLDAFLQEQKKRGERVMLMTGTRAHESRRRMGNQKTHSRFGGRVWCNPLNHFTNDEMWEYRQRFNLPRNEVADHLHMSGECLCGAFAKPHEKEGIRFFYPEVAARLDSIEKQAVEAGIPPPWCRWGHGRDNSQGSKAPKSSGPLCTSCDVAFDLWQEEKAVACS